MSSIPGNGLLSFYRASVYYDIFFKIGIFRYTMDSNTMLPENYADLLRKKSDKIQQQFSALHMPELQVYPSNFKNFRMRAEFRIWHKDNTIHYAMFEPGCKNSVYFLKNFPIASTSINNLMQPLLEKIKASENLYRSLFQIEFLTTQLEETLVSLIYHRALDDSWEKEAGYLEIEFGIHIIGRSRKQKRILSQEYVMEKLSVNDRIYHYRQYENSFTQPNAGVNEKMLAWVENTVKYIEGDLLELYCGGGNFTCILSRHFQRILATEISKKSVETARQNFLLNNIENVAVVRMSSEEITQALNHDRLFRRLKYIDLDSYCFDTVFVDPPRSGLDGNTLLLVKKIKRIIYISCNPDTLYKDLTVLLQTHTVEKFALFDQFPYTHHAECGVYMIRR